MLEMVVAAETQGVRGSVAKLRCVSERVRKGEHYKIPEMLGGLFLFFQKKKKMQRLMWSEELNSSSHDL